MSSYKVVYFNGRGRAELTRLIFNAAGQAFEDVRVTDWPAGKEGVFTFVFKFPFICSYMYTQVIFQFVFLIFLLLIRCSMRSTSILGRR